jgi:hypothetical protein
MKAMGKRMLVQKVLVSLAMPMNSNIFWVMPGPTILGDARSHQDDGHGHQPHPGQQQHQNDGQELLGHDVAPRPDVVGPVDGRDQGPHRHGRPPQRSEQTDAEQTLVVFGQQFQHNAGNVFGRFLGHLVAEGLEHQRPEGITQGKRAYQGEQEDQKGKQSQHGVEGDLGRHAHAVVVSHLPLETDQKQPGSFCAS